MHWIDQYQLFLFDFDGLLVNTEEIHFQAYQNMCADQGYHLPWSFAQYCSIAHYHSDGLRQKIYAEFPKIESNWDILYGEKKKWVEKLLQAGKVTLMPGVTSLLQALTASGTPACVVTHSPLEQIQLIREQHPLLNQIPHWITRRDYAQPKPDPECYLKAIDLYGKTAKHIIGFEDTPRGLKALAQTQSQPVWISQIAYPEIEEWRQQGVIHARSFEELKDHVVQK